MVSEQGRATTAVAARREVLALDEDAADPLVKAENLAELGFALQQAGQHAEAVTALRGGYGGYLEHGQPWPAGWSARRLAASYQELDRGGDAAAALEDGVKAYELAREWDGEQLGHTLMELAEQYRALGRHADEITALARATSVWAEGLDHLMMPLMGTHEEEYQGNLLDVLRLRAAAEEANGSGANAERILQGINEGLTSGRFGSLDKMLDRWIQSNIDLVEFYERASRHDDAARYSELALARLDQSGNSENRRLLLWKDGWNRYQLGDYAGAAPPLREACRLYFATNETQDAIKVHRLLASVLQAGRRNREAAQVYRTIEVLYEGLDEPIEAARARGAAIALRMRGKVRRERDF